MRLALKLHPDSHCVAVARIDVDVARPRADSLIFSYVVSGRIDHLCLPPVTASARTDELWRHTCFEAFLRPPSRESYYEFNFAPSTQWAAYSFGSYRNGMRVADDIGVPTIDVQSETDRYALQATLALSNLPRDASWRLGLSAVIEEIDGNKSYWALAHPQGRPDFHHGDCFALELSTG
jgi:hypothetical protein